MGKKEYESPVVTKVEINFNDRIVAAGCTLVATDCWGQEPYQNS